ncbi:MAG: trimeric intracellular cation channel family protein [Saprospirales bacterium]|nr:MAG: trimeric intracellular cation channel family protein [Saprospirales bacterium]
MFSILDLAGTAVFAMSGALAGMQKRFDPFGVMIIALVTAIGGGTLRDILIGRLPVGWMQDMSYLYVILAAAMAAFVFRSRLLRLRKTFFLFDTLGLGLFTITGVELGLQAGLHPIICILLGTMSASFGGVLRDVLSNEVPVIFQKEIYASASIAGGTVFLLLLETGWDQDIIYILTSLLVIVIRLLAVKFQWSLPRMYLPERKD